MSGAAVYGAVQYGQYHIAETERRIKYYRKHKHKHKYTRWSFGEPNEPHRVGGLLCEKCDRPPTKKWVASHPSLMSRLRRKVRHLR